jgi:hypothetical protein
MARIRTVLVTCPICKGTLEVNAANGKVLRKFPYKDNAAGGDQLAEALEDVKKSVAKADEKFKSAQEKERSKFERLEKAFREKKKIVDEEGDTGKPLRDIDLD